MNRSSASKEGEAHRGDRFIATCPDETRDVLFEELTALGATGLELGPRSVGFDASEAVFYALHLQLRTASRLLRVIKTVPAHTSAMLFSQARRIHWHEYFDPRHGFRVDVPGTGRGSLEPKQVLTQVREAIRDVFERHRGCTPRVDVDEPKVVVVAHVANGRCTLSFDTCGKSLHKRGYREAGHPAPMKETLAAAILSLAGYDGSQPFFDPMCGSGTLAVEAAMIALDKAPQIHRKKGDFNFEWLANFDRELWRTTQDRARAARRESCPAPVIAADVSATYVALAKKTALAARVERHIRFHTGRFQDCEAPTPTGILVANLPYGERLATADGDARTFYAEVGDTLKNRFAGWRAALLVVAASPYQAIGLKPTRKIPILNGNLECKLLVFDIYAGSKRSRPAPPT